MILFTAKGSFQKVFSSKYACETISLRSAEIETFSSSLRRADIIIHNAANIKCDNAISCVSDNFNLTKKLVDYVYFVNPKAHIIFLSSMSILDETNENMYKDVQKMSPYAYSKYVAETYCQKHPFEQNISAVRFSTIFYGDKNKDGLSKLIADACECNQVKIYNGGKDKRDFIPIDTAVEYVHKITLSKKKEKIYNIVSGYATRFSDIVTHLHLLKPHLNIVDVKLPMTRVLSTFSDASINKLGKIDFDLYKKIDVFVNTFSAVK